MLERRDGHKADSWTHFTHLKLTCLGRGHYTPWYFASNLKLSIEDAYFHYLLLETTMLGRRDGHKADSWPHFTHLEFYLPWKGPLYTMVFRFKSQIIHGRCLLSF